MYRFTYMYQDNISPAFGIDLLVIKITLTPVANFSITSANFINQIVALLSFCKNSLMPSPQRV